MTINVNIEETWLKSLSAIAQKVGENSFDLWFKPMKMVQFKDKNLIIEIPNRFYREWVDDNYPQLLSETIESLLGYKITVKFKISEKEDAAIKRIENKHENRRKELGKRGIYLNPKYIFENYVVGTSNQFAHAAAKRVAENPGGSYNPLFIYGGVGLGKTHLINAIGNFIVDKQSTTSVCYISAEQFTNEVISAMRHDRMADFKSKYRNTEVLLIDDIQFIAGKTATQEEFFHTFNALYEKQKQIVISSDRAPIEISDITDRLRSRFSMGLIADIQSPDIETKMAIIYKKALTEKMSISEDVAHFIASKIKSNIRDLEGCLIRLGAHASLTATTINLDLAKAVLKDLMLDDDKPVTVELIQKIVCEYFGIKIQDIKAKKRTKEIANARQIAMFLAKQYTEHSLSEIGRFFGGKDHATVIYACKQVEERMLQEENFRKNIENLRKRIVP
ncbi:MAG: chromosomal replication initiator protein DnaA [Nitrospirae bacterium]|nr:chromosomal replication initiator protein DnaA [Nitrospirota bacterium]